MNDFKIDPILLKAKIPSISAKIAGICTDVAACTPTPFDDMLAASLAGPIASLLERFLTIGPVAMGAEEGDPVEAHLVADAAAHGRILTPEHLALIGQIIKLLLPLLPLVL